MYWISGYGGKGGRGCLNRNNVKRYAKLESCGCVCGVVGC